MTNIPIASWRTFIARSFWTIGVLTVFAMSALPTSWAQSGNDSAPAAKAETAKQDPNALTLVVMDPLAAPLACDCVQGYAQRKYEKLGEFLASKLRCEVDVVFAESLKQALKDTSGRADLVIGKHSVVAYQAQQNDLAMRPVMQLTGKDDSVTQTGLLVVRSSDSAEKTSDLQGYRFLFGPIDCDEKHAAPLALLKANKISLPEKLETASSCSVAAKQLMELPEGTKAVAVISSYAQPLLEGCGNIKKGDLKVVGETDPIPFITAFVNEKLAESRRDELVSALDEVGLDADLLIHLETGTGFVPWKGETKPVLAGPRAGRSEPAATSSSTKKK